MMRELVGKDSEDGIEFSGLHGPRSVEVDGDCLFSDLCVAEPETAELSASAHAATQGPKFEIGKSEHHPCPRKKMINKRFMLWVENVRHLAGARAR